MIQINQIEQQVSLTVNPITEVINIEVTEIIHSVYVVAKEEPAESSTFNQNNVDVVKTVQTLHSDKSLEWLSDLNELTPYTINEFQSLWVRVIVLNQSNVPDKTIIYKVINKGKGDYGLNKTQFLLEDLFFVAQSGISVQDIINEETTIVINLGEHTSHVIKDVVNSQNPPILIQNQALGQTIFTVLDDEIVYSYLWTGTAGTYGVGSLQSTAADFQVLNDQPQLISNLYVEKSYYTPLVVPGTGIIDTINLDIKNSALKIQGTVTEIKSIQKNSSNFYIIGQPFFLYNETASPLKIPHLTGSGNIQFFNPEVADYFAEPGEVTMFLLENVGGNLRYKRSTTRLQQKSVTLDKIEDIASGSILGRISSGTGQPEPLDWIDVLFLLGLETIEMDVYFKQEKPIVISVAKTAVNDEVYHNVGNNTYADPTGVLGKGYYVNNISGTLTVGGNAYSPETYLFRYYDGTSWFTNVLKKGISNFNYEGNKTITPLDHDDIIFMDSGTLTVNPNTQDYKNGHANAVKPSGASNTPLVLTAATGWSYIINGGVALASASVFGEKGGTFTIIRKSSTKIFYIDGSVI